MVTIRFVRSKGVLRSFESKGHALYGDFGQDIVCAAVSALSINCANSLEAFTEDPFSVDSGEGFLSLRLDGEPSEKASLLMESLLLGLTGIEKEYGRKHLRVLIQEVS